MKEQILNGIKLIDCTNAVYHSFCIGVYIKAGCMYEPEQWNGITHLYEHCVFRNIKKQYSEDFYELLTRHGLDFNACTYKEFVQFELTGIPSGVGFAADILSKLFLPFSLSAEEYHAEIKRIKAEIREESETKGLNYLLNTHVWNGTSLANTITGTCANLDRVSRKRLEQYRQSILSPGNILVCLTGNISSDHMDQIRKTLRQIPVSETDCCNDNTAPVPRNFGMRSMDVHMGHGDFYSIAMGFDIDNSRCPAAIRDLIYAILFSGDSSLFFRHLSEDNQLLYSYHAKLEQYRNISNIQVFFEVGRTDILPVICEIRRILDFLKTGEFSLENNLQKLLSNWEIQQDYVADFNWAIAFENHILGAAPVCMDKPMLGRYDAISREQIMICANEIFRKENMTFAIRGPKRRIPITEIRKELELFGS